MKTSLRLFLAAFLYCLLATCASADITWTLNDVTFNNGNQATGFFTTNDSVTAFDGFSISITGPTSEAAFTVTQMIAPYLPGAVGMANSDFSEYVFLILASNLTSAGGIVNISTGFDCQGCGTLNVEPDTEVIGVTPEPASLILMGSGLLAIAGLLGRKRRALERQRS